MTIERRAAPKAPPFAIDSWIRPLPVPKGRHSIAGGWAAFDAVDLLQRDGDAYSISRTTPEELLAMAADCDRAAAALDRLTAPRPAFAGLAMDRPHIMGILNVTPDSFSDGGRHSGPARAIAAGRAMAETGASIIDIGGESTRPGAAPVTRNQELARAAADCRAEGGRRPAVDRHPPCRSDAPRDEAGARIINDVNGLRGDGALDAAADSAAAVVIMHMQGTPEMMQAAPSYGFAPVVDSWKTHRGGAGRRHPEGEDRRRSRIRLRQDGAAQSGAGEFRRHIPWSWRSGADRGQPQIKHRRHVGRRGCRPSPCRIARSGDGDGGAGLPAAACARCRRDTPGAGHSGGACRRRGRRVSKRVE